jgi:hypothetical protein
LQELDLKEVELKRSQLVVEEAEKEEAIARRSLGTLTSAIHRRIAALRWQYAAAVLHTGSRHGGGGLPSLNIHSLPPGSHPGLQQAKALTAALLHAV